MKKHLFQLFLIFLTIHFGCNSPKDPVLLEAFEIHKEAIDIGAKALELCEKLPANDSMRSQFRTTLEVWGDNVVEVPGFHYHHDGLGHHHGRTPLNLPPDDVLIFQKELRDSIKSILDEIQMYQPAQSRQ